MPNKTVTELKEEASRGYRTSLAGADDAESGAESPARGEHTGSDDGADGEALRHTAAGDGGGGSMTGFQHKPPALSIEDDLLLPPDHAGPRAFKRNRSFFLSLMLRFAGPVYLVALYFVLVFLLYSGGDSQVLETARRINISLQRRVLVSKSTMFAQSAVVECGAACGASLEQHFNSCSEHVDDTIKILRMGLYGSAAQHVAPLRNEHKQLLELEIVRACAASQEPDVCYEGAVRPHASHQPR